MILNLRVLELQRQRQARASRWRGSARRPSRRAARGCLPALRSRRRPRRTSSPPRCSCARRADRPCADRRPSTAQRDARPNRRRAPRMRCGPAARMSPMLLQAVALKRRRRPPARRPAASTTARDSRNASASARPITEKPRGLSRSRRGLGQELVEREADGDGEAALVPDAVLQLDQRLRRACRRAALRCRRGP